MRGLLLILAVGAGCAGCGGGEKHGATAPSHTSAAIVEHFKRETGDTLVPGRVRAPGLESLGIAHGEPQLVRKYGRFDIYVVTRNPAVGVRRVLEADPGGKTDGPDQSGLYWTRTCPPKVVRLPCFFIAQRRFGANVVLSWIAGAQRKTDARFTRLTSVLETLP